MNTKEQTCAELVAIKMQERESELKELMDNPESDWSDDPALSVETTQITKICLSYGGPADYLEAYWEKDRFQYDGVYRVVYRFSDWFDTATYEVEEGSALWNYANIIVESEAERWN